ncbi:MAG: hypothetical protein IPO09_14070 [Anaeromyxobacter sp.]|nr:hypothetical protein [Anaeromyxobacter sp.]MBL0275315.1 hypothetical protein [Anaeromyxobacter sp.]
MPAAPSHRPLRRRTSPSAALAVPLLAGLLAAGCGGGSDTPTVVPPPDCSALTAAAAPDPWKVVAPAWSAGASPAPAQPAATCTTTVTASVTGPWQLLAPAAWSGCDSLTLSAPALAADERLALLLVNAGGPDRATPAITTAGTAQFLAAGPVASAAAGPLALASTSSLEDRSPQARGHALVVARREETMRRWLAAGGVRPAPAARATAVAPAEPAQNRSFCVFSYTTKEMSRKAATLVHASRHALFYVADERLGALEATLTARRDLWTTLESYFEGTPDAARNPGGARRIFPALTESFGAPSDVDANCRLIFLFADLGGSAANGFTVGYFDPGDVVYPADTSSDCSGSGSNGADMLYLLDPAKYRSNSGLSYDTIIDQEVPGTMAHELQHDVFYNVRCRGNPPLPSCSEAAMKADLFLNEGLSMVSEDFAGFGLATATERGRVGRYLRDYQGFSLTTWPTTGGDPAGDYGGAHAFLRWHLDQATRGLAAAPSAPAFSRALVASPLAARAALAAASGISFEEGYARFATGALFSGETFTPQPAWSFATGVPWSPLHTTVGYAGYTSLPRPAQPTFVTSLRNDGWGAYVTGLGQGQEATLRLDSTAAVKPHAVVVRFKGSLPKP